MQFVLFYTAVFFNWSSAEPKGSASGIQEFQGTAGAQ